MPTLPFAPPFDNLYKFRAIAGLLIMLVCGVLLVQQVHWHRSAIREVEMQMVREAPLDALVLQEIRRSRDGSPADTSLQRRLAEMRSRGDERSKVLENLVTDQDEAVRVVFPALIGFMILGAVLFLWGMHDWSDKVQEPETDLLQLKVRQALREDLATARANGESVQTRHIRTRMAELDQKSRKTWLRQHISGWRSEQSGPADERGSAGADADGR